MTMSRILLDTIYCDVGEGFKRLIVRHLSGGEWKFTMPGGVRTLAFYLWRL